MIGRSPSCVVTIPCVNPFARHVRKLLVHKLCRPGVSLADEVPVEPLARDALELAEEVQLWLFAGVAPLGLQQSLGQVEEQGRAAEIAGVDQVQIDPFPDDPLVAGNRWADEIGRQLQRRVVVELGGETLLRQLDAVARHPREADLARVALRGDCPYEHGLARRLRRHRHRPCREVERDAEDVGVLDVEESLGVASYDWRRSARPMTCSQRSCVPNARTPRTWVTVRASQPPVSIETETTHRIDPPSVSGLPTVFITSRSRS